MFELFLRAYYGAVPSACQEKLRKLEQDILNVKEEIKLLRRQNLGRYTSTNNEKILLVKYHEAFVKFQSFREKYSQEKREAVE